MDLEEFAVCFREKGKAYSNGPWVGVYHKPCEGSPHSWTYRGDIDTAEETDLAWLNALAEKHVCPSAE